MSQNEKHHQKYDSSIVTKHVPESMATVSNAIRNDPSYAWSWHCNIAMAAVDEGVDHMAANKLAARFLMILTGVDTTKNPHFPKESVDPELTYKVNRWERFDNTLFARNGKQYASVIEVKKVNDSSLVEDTSVFAQQLADLLNKVEKDGREKVE